MHAHTNVHNRRETYTAVSSREEIVAIGEALRRLSLTNDQWLQIPTSCTFACSIFVCLFSSPFSRRPRARAGVCTHTCTRVFVVLRAFSARDRCVYTSASWHLLVGTYPCTGGEAYTPTKIPRYACGTYMFAIANRAASRHTSAFSGPCHLLLGG